MIGRANPAILTVQDYFANPCVARLIENPVEREIWIMEQLTAAYRRAIESGGGGRLLKDAVLTCAARMCEAGKLNTEMTP